MSDILTMRRNVILTDSGGAVISILPVNLTQVGGAAITLGQKVRAASIPVTMASDQGSGIAYETLRTGTFNSGGSVGGPPDYSSFPVGMALALGVTANPGGGQTLSLSIRSTSPSFAQTRGYINFGVVVTAANTEILCIAHPGITLADYAASGGLGAIFAKNAAVIGGASIVRIDHSGAGNWTYTLSAIWLP